MPNYEYQCGDCGAYFEVYLAYSEYGTAVTCPSCHGGNVQRSIGRVSFLRSGSGAGSGSGELDPSALEGLEDNPQELGRFIRHMGDELGEDLGPEFDEVVDRLVKGQSPEEIERALPDLGGEGSEDVSGAEGDETYDEASSW